MLDTLVTFVSAFLLVVQAMVGVGPDRVLCISAGLCAGHDCCQDAGRGGCGGASLGFLEHDRACASEAGCHPAADEPHAMSVGGTCRCHVHVPVPGDEQSSGWARARNWGNDVRGWPLPVILATPPWSHWPPAAISPRRKPPDRLACDSARSLTTTRLRI